MNLTDRHCTRVDADTEFHEPKGYFFCSGAHCPVVEEWHCHEGDALGLQ